MPAYIIQVRFEQLWIIKYALFLVSRFHSPGSPAEYERAVEQHSSKQIVIGVKVCIYFVTFVNFLDVCSKN